MIEVADLHKSYGSLKAVDGVSFSVARGETFALLGPNGAGKTTTILMLTGALRPDRGTIHVAGQHDPTQVEVRRQLGFAPQALALYEQLTVGFSERRTTGPSTATTNSPRSCCARSCAAG